MKLLVKAAAVCLAIAVPLAATADEEDNADPSAETFTLEMKEDAPFKDVILEQHRLLKKILDIQEKTLLILKKSEKSGAKKQAEKLLKKVRKAKKDAERLDEEIEKASNRPKKSKTGLTFGYSYTEEDELAP